MKFMDMDGLTYILSVIVKKSLSSKVRGKKLASNLGFHNIEQNL